MRRRGAGGSERGVSDGVLVGFCVVVTLTGVLLVWDRLRRSSGLGPQETPALDTRAAAAAEPAHPHRDPTEEERARSEERVEPTAPAVAAAEESPRPAEGVAPPRVSPLEPAPRVTRPEPAPPRAEPRPAAAAPPVAGGSDIPAGSATRRLLDRLCADLEALHAVHGRYPTSSRAFGANRGVEALYLALARIGAVDGLRVGDTDDDGRVEILDAWGRPLVYFSSDDYRSRQSWAPGDGAAVTLSPSRLAGGAVFDAAGTFQIRSVGPDGRPGDAHDDVTSWTLR